MTKYVRNCFKCLIDKSVSGRKPGLLHPIPKVEAPFEVVHVDHLGPFSKSKKGHQYVIALQDGFSKYCFLEAVADTSTTGVIKALKAMVYLFGVPRRLICDRGTAFTSRAMKVFCKENGIQLVIHSLNLPRANGQVEH